MSELQPPYRDMYETYENAPTAGYDGERSERQELVEQWKALSGLLTESDVIRARLEIATQREQAIRELHTLAENSLSKDALPVNWQNRSPEELLGLVQTYIRHAANQVEQVIDSLGSLS